jgi:hypothetical protein
MESSPREQPFEQGNAQGVSSGTLIDLIKGEARLPEAYLSAFESLFMRSVGAYNSLDTLLHYATSELE